MMTTIPTSLRRDMETDPRYLRCDLQNLLVNLIGYCDGRITREHAIYYANKKVQEKWAIPPICAKHHGVDQYQDNGTASKEIRVWVALNRATDEELRSVSKVVNYFRERGRLNMKYGKYVCPTYPGKVVDKPPLSPHNISVPYGKCPAWYTT